MAAEPMSSNPGAETVRGEPVEPHVLPFGFAQGGLSAQDERTPSPPGPRHPFQTDPTGPPELQHPQRLSQGLVHVITGNGKGKTTAAFGLGLRAVGHGLRVYAAQFMKGDLRYGEFLSVRHLPNFTLERFGTGGLVDMNNPSDADREEARRGLARVREIMLSGDHDVMLLDEINVAVAWKLLPLDEVLQFIRDKPSDVELVLTGRYADPKLVEAADYVTMLGQVKHPYQQGIIARQGIDY